MSNEPKEIWGSRIGTQSAFESWSREDMGSQDSYSALLRSSLTVPFSVLSLLECAFVQKMEARTVRNFGLKTLQTTKLIEEFRTVRTQAIGYKFLFFSFHSIDPVPLSKCFTYVTKTIANLPHIIENRGITMAPLFLRLTS